MRLIVQCSECGGTNMLQLNGQDLRIKCVDCDAEYECAGVEFMFHVEMDLQ